MTAGIGRLGAALALLAAIVLLVAVFAPPAYTLNNFTLVASDVTMAKVSGTTITLFEVSGGSLN